MARKIKIGNAVLCEHAVQGSGNKPILINVYSGDIIVSQLPSGLTFGAFVEVAAGESISEIEVQITLNAIQLIALKADLPESAKGGPSNLVIPMFPMQVTDDDSVFEITLTADGFAKTSVIRKTISIAR